MHFIECAKNNIFLLKLPCYRVQENILCPSIFCFGFLSTKFVALIIAKSMVQSQQGYQREMHWKFYSSTTRRMLVVALDKKRSTLDEPLNLKKAVNEPETQCQNICNMVPRMEQPDVVTIGTSLFVEC